MKWFRVAKARLRGLLKGEAVEQDIDDELRCHLEMLTEENLRRGLGLEEARRQALKSFGNFSRTKEAALDVRGGGMMDILWQDLRFGIRVLGKNLSFTTIAVLTLALGIGANTAIFSIVHAVLLRPLPFRDPDRLVFLAEKTHEGNMMSVAYPNYNDWRERAQSFEEIAAFQGQSFNLTGIDKPVQVRGRRVSWNFFHILGISPQLGRLFIEQDDSPGAATTTLISNGLWKERFGGDPDVLGKVIKVDGTPFTIVGVLPPGFEFFRRGDLFVPLGPFLTPQSSLLVRGNHSGLFALARLKSGVTLAQAHEEMQTLAAQLEQEYPRSNSGNGATAQSLADAFVEDIRPSLLVLLGAVGFVLLIACVNVANLMLVRAAERHKEIAIRLALGAGRGRIVRQLFIESMLVAAAGGAAGLLIGFWAMQGLLSLSPPNVPRLAEIKLDGPVLIFTLCVSMMTGLLFGLLPAFQASRTNLLETLKESGRSGSSSLRERTRKILLIAEVSLAFVLLIGAGLMLRTISRLTAVDVGFDAENLLTMRFALTGEAYSPEKQRAFYSECIERVESQPGVVRAALTLSLPIDGSNWNSIFIVADKPVPPREDMPSAAFTPVSANYFETLGVRLLRGRTFTSADALNPKQVTVINETLAHRLWPDEDAIGKQLKQGWPEDKNSWREVIGVVSDVKLDGVDRDAPLQAYLPLSQEPARSLALVVRTHSNPLALAATVEEAVRSIDNDLPVFNTRSMNELLGNAVAQQRLTMVLLAGFALLALILAAVGIYGVMSYAVTQRTHEIGIRMAMGARPRDVLKLVVGQGITLALIGVGVGLAAAFGLTRLMSSMLFGVSATDHFTFGGVALLLIVVALTACYIPARRAMKTDPMIALRYE